MPIIMLSSNAAVLIILVLGGHYVIAGTMSLGDFVAFNSYMVILIFPIIIIGFMSGVIAQATTSYGRIREVLDGPLRVKTGTLRAHLTGNIEVRNLSLVLAGKEVIKDISFDIKPGSRTAILGPTAAGKTELLYLLS